MGKRILSLFLFLVSCTGWGALQEMGESLHSTVKGTAGVVQTICLVMGAGLVTGAVIKYQAYRSDPAETPLGTPIILLLLGLALIAMGLIPMPKS